MPGRQRGAWFIALPRRMQEKAVLWVGREESDVSECVWVRVPWRCLNRHLEYCEGYFGLYPVGSDVRRAAGWKLYLAPSHSSVQETLEALLKKPEGPARKMPYKSLRKEQCEDKGSRGGTGGSDGRSTMGRLGRSGCGVWWLNAKNQICLLWAAHRGELRWSVTTLSNRF